MNFLYLFLIISVLSQCFCDEIVEVNLKQGAMLGKVERTLYKNQEYYSFRGIPFAESPTGELRFQPPIPHQGWDGILEAFQNKPTCMQFNTRSRLREAMGMSGAEDCLYINIHSPNVKGNAPVIVFDYNDNFRTWFNGTDAFSPDFLIEEDVLVATVSNRLGVFGYLTTEDGVIQGNNGLRDFILGLEWIKDNIEKFGGDPSRVTLMGSRGGATIADILLYTEKTKGLFSSAILQSGTSLETLYFFNNPAEKAFQLGEHLNLTVSNSYELLELLQNVDAETILAAELGILVSINNEDHFTQFPFAPVIEYGTEDRVLTGLPDNENVVNDVPIIIGFNSREGFDLLSHYLRSPNFLTNEHEDKMLQLPIRTGFKFDPDSKKFKEANRAIVDFYFTDKTVNFGNILEYAVYAGDYTQNYALNFAAEKLSKSLSSPVFYYIFDFKGLWNYNSEILSTRSSISLGSSGATVIDELCYLFVCSGLKKTYQELLNLPSEQPELKVTKKMVRLWSNFAKTGNPTSMKGDAILKDFTWEPFSSKTGFKYMHITKNLRMKTNPLAERKQFWEDFLEKYSKEAIDGIVRDEESRDEL